MKHVNMKILGVYNANSGVVGEVIYFLGKLSGATHCAFCDITHSYFVKKNEKTFLLLDKHSLSEFGGDVTKFKENLQEALNDHK